MVNLIPINDVAVGVSGCVPDTKLERPPFNLIAFGQSVGDKCYARIFRAINRAIKSFANISKTTDMIIVVVGNQHSIQL